jgi:hypothetical protein
MFHADDPYIMRVLKELHPCASGLRGSGKQRDDDSIVRRRRLVVCAGSSSSLFSLCCFKLMGAVRVQIGI